MANTVLDNLIAQHLFSALKIKHSDGRQFAYILAPEQGWTPYQFWHVCQSFPPHWQHTSLWAYFGDTPIGGGNIKELLCPALG